MMELVLYLYIYIYYIYVYLHESEQHEARAGVYDNTKSPNSDVFVDCLFCVRVFS